MEELMDSLQKERVEAASVVLIEGYRALSVDDPDYSEKLEKLSGLHKEISNDVKAYKDNVVELKKLETDKYKCDETSIIESEKVRVAEEQNVRLIELEERKLVALERQNKTSAVQGFVGIGLDIAKIALGGSLGYLGLASKLWMFTQATKFEENDAYVTTTQKLTVQNALRETGSLEKNWQLSK